MTNDDVDQDGHNYHDDQDHGHHDDHDDDGEINDSEAWWHNPQWR